MIFFLLFIHYSFRLYIIKKSFSINEIIEIYIFSRTFEKIYLIFKINLILSFFNFFSCFCNKLLGYFFLLIRWYTFFFLSNDILSFSANKLDLTNCFPCSLVAFICYFPKSSIAFFIFPKLFLKEKK